MTQFALGLGTPAWGFGILVAIPALATLLQLLGSVVLTRGFGAKRLFLISQLGCRVLWVVVGAIPWFWPDALGAPWHGMLLILVAVWALHHLGFPAWMNWMADVVPRSVRGHFFGVRQRVARPIAITATVAVGAALDMVERVGGDGSLMRQATSALIMAAGLFGVLEVLMYRRVDAPPADHVTPSARWWRRLADPLQDRNFRWFLLCSACLGMSSGFLAQYVWLYMFDVGGYSNLQANLLGVALPGAVNLLIFPLWGRIVDRHGRRPVIAIALTGMLINPIGWILVCSQAYIWIGIPIVMVGFCMWPGLELATTNYMIDLAGARDEETGGTAYVAVNNIALAGAGIISGLMGSACALWLEDLHWGEKELGFPITYHAVLFGMASVLRVFALLCALQFKEAGSAPARDLMRYMTSSLYGNVRQAFLMPIRAVSQPLARSYRLRNGEEEEEGIEERGASNE